MAFANVHRIDPGWKLGPLTFFFGRCDRWSADERQLIVLPSLTFYVASYRGEWWAWLQARFWRSEFAVYFDYQKLKRILPGQSTGQNDNQKR